MSTNEKITPHLLLLQPIDVLQKVAFFNKNNIHERVKWCEVFAKLSGGVTIKGFPIEIDNDCNTLFILQDDTLAYYNTKTLVGVEITSLYHQLEFLTNNEYLDISNDKVPSEFQVKRHWSDFVIRCKEDFDLNMKESFIGDNNLDTIERYQVPLFLEILYRIFKDIASNPMGKEAIASIQQVVITNATNSKVSKTGDKLELNINFKSRFPQDFEQNIKKEIESKL